MLGQNFFLLLQRREKGESTYLHPRLLKPSTKQERPDLWIFPNFLRDLSMSFGTGRAGSVCPWPERLIPDWSWSVLACCSCMGEKQSLPQSMSLPMLLLLALSKLYGLASYYVHSFVIFWSAYGFAFYGVCTTCCSLTLGKITAFPLEASTVLQHACMHAKCLPAYIVCWPWWR